ncbi:hypothetical protein GCM10007147_24410 [Nocardiopsis kunsanensis]|uniref:Uncharacterized protein n=1 Tax=Nocardiopsis kunsanensis TaxID=141693 RepID=A0A918XCQ7_9ACTN|nr:hypothetical protein GCM10007147_24410 [Nocardiopsis kunsanensis]
MSGVCRAKGVRTTTPVRGADLCLDLMVRRFCAEPYRGGPRGAGDGMAVNALRTG